MGRWLCWNGIRSVSRTVAASLTLLVIALAFSVFEYGLGPRQMDDDPLMQLTGSQFNAWLITFLGALAVLAILYGLAKASYVVMTRTLRRFLD